MKRTKPPSCKSEGFLILDKRMVRLFGKHTAHFICNLLDKYFYWKEHNPQFDGSFFLTHKQQTEQTDLSDHQIRMAKQQAILNKWLVTRWKGNPAKEWYEINMESPDIQIAIEFLKGKPSNDSIPILIKPNNNLPHILEEDDNFLNEERRITITHFDKFWHIYPRKEQKGEAQLVWNKLCFQPDPPKWPDIFEAVLAQKKSEQWKYPKYIPLPTNWLKKKRWLDDPNNMKAYPPKDMKAFMEYNGRRYYAQPNGKYISKSGEIWSD